MCAQSRHGGGWLLQRVQERQVEARAPPPIGAVIGRTGRSALPRHNLMICAVGAAGSCKHGRNNAAGLESPVKLGGSLVRWSLSAARLRDAMAPEPTGWSESGNGGPAVNALAMVMLLVSFVVAGLGYVGYRIMTRGQRVVGRGQQALCAITGND